MHCDPHTTAPPWAGPDASQARSQESLDAHELRGATLLEASFCAPDGCSYLTRLRPGSQKALEEDRDTIQALCYDQGGYAVRQLQMLLMLLPGPHRHNRLRQDETARSDPGLEAHDQNSIYYSLCKNYGKAQAAAWLFQHLLQCAVQTHLDRACNFE